MSISIKQIMQVQQDNRFTIKKEYCGYKVKRFVLRFCGDFITSSENKNLCYYAAIKHNKERF